MHLKSLLFFLLFSLCCSVYGQTVCNLTVHEGINFGNNATDRMYDLKLQTDGKMIAFGASYYISSNTFEIAMARFMPKNGLDTTFGNKGKVAAKFDSRNSAYAGAVRADGKIYAAGYQAPSNGISGFRPFVARFNHDGSIDSTFGVNGSALINTLGRGSAIGLHTLPNNKVMAAIITGSPAGVALVQLKDDGTYDSSFASNGVSRVNVPNMAWQVEYGHALFKKNGKIVVIGKTLVPTNPCIVQFNADGKLDTNFANRGVQIIPVAIKYNFANIHGALDSSDRILISATNNSPAAFNLWRLKQNGDIDSTFGVNGLSSAKSTTFSESRGVIVNPLDGSIMHYGVGGSSGRQPAIHYNDSDGHPIGGCKNDTFEIFYLNFRFGHYFTNSLYDHQNNLRLFGMTSQNEVTGATEGLNFMRMSKECLQVTDSITVDACKSYTSPSGKYIWTSSGSFVDTLTNPAQCNLDSILQISLQISNPEIGVSQTKDTLLANALNASYQWVDCDSGFKSITGANTREFVAMRDGNYAVIIDSAGCSDTSSCYNVMKEVIINGIDGMEALQFSLQPNPSSDFVRITTVETNEDIDVSIISLTGKVVYQRTLRANQGNLNIAHNLPEGLYIVQVSYSGQTARRKLVVNN